jgi:hypothetical protein
MNIVAVVKAFFVQSAGAALLLISLMPVLSVCTPGTLLCATGGPDPLAWVAFGAGLILVALGTWMFISMARGPKDEAVDDFANDAIEDSPETASVDGACDEAPPEMEAVAEPAPVPTPGRRRSISASAMAEAD